MSEGGHCLRNSHQSRMHSFAICLITTLATSIPQALGTKRFPTATKPPVPPPPPPLIVFDQPQQSERPPQARFEYFELIAPSQNQQNYNPTLSISNPDFSVSYRPRPQPQQPQRPQIPQPQRPQRPQQQQPQRPSTMPPFYQFPQQPRPQRPNSQVVARPRPRPAKGSQRPLSQSPPREESSPDRNFSYLNYNQLQQPV